MMENWMKLEELETMENWIKLEELEMMKLDEVE
jgi:hypothetical protein